MRKRRVTSFAWGHFDEVRGKEKTYMCKYCTKKVYKNITRMETHLLNKCKNVPEAVKKNKLKPKRVKRDNISRSDTESVFSLSSSASSLPAIPEQSTLLPFVDTCSTKSKEKLEVLLARAIYVAGCPLSLVENQEWSDFFREIRPSFVIPSRFRLANSLLDDEYNRVKIKVEASIAKGQDLCLQCDGWTNIRNESILNFIVTTPQPYFVRSIPTKEEQHTGAYLSEQMNKILQQYGSKKFLAVVTDNARNMSSAANILEKEHQHITFFGCLAHTLHLFVGDIISMKSINKIINQAKKIIKLVNNTHVLHALFEKKSEEEFHNKPQSLKMPALTRWGSVVDCLKSLIDNKFTLQELFVCREAFNKMENTTKLNTFKECKTLILREEFWSNLEAIFLLLKPVKMWIMRLEADTPTVHLVCSALKELEQTLDHLETTPMTAAEKTKITEKFKQRKTYALKPIHLAADLLHPLYTGINLTDTQCSEAINYIKKVGVDLNLNIADVMRDIMLFKAKEEIWGNDYMWEFLNTNNNDNVKGVTWWKAFCSSSPLCRIAVRILSMPSTSAATERSFKTQSNVHTKKRNRLTNERVIKITYIKHNTTALRTKSAVNKSISANRNENSMITEVTNIEPNTVAEPETVRRQFSEPVSEDESYESDLTDDDDTDQDFCTSGSDEEDTTPCDIFDGDDPLGVQPDEIENDDLGKVTKAENAEETGEQNENVQVYVIQNDGTVYLEN